MSGENKEDPFDPKYWSDPMNINYWNLGYGRGWRFSREIHRQRTGEPTPDWDKD